MLHIHLAIRRLTRTIGPSLAATLALGSGLAAVQATWAVISHTLLKPLPVSASWHVLSTVGREGRTRREFTYDVISKVRQTEGINTAIAAWVPNSRIAVSGTTFSGPAVVSFVSGDFLTALGVPMRLGRSLISADDLPGASPVVVVTEAFWKREMREDPHVLNSTLRFGSHEAVVVGILRGRFRGIDATRPADVFMSLHSLPVIASPHANYFADPHNGSAPSSSFRIAFDTHRSDGSSEIDTRLTQSLGLLPASGRVVSTSIQEAATPASTRPVLRRLAIVLGSTVFALFLVTIGSTVSLFANRVLARRGEIATHLALGAAFGDILRGVVAEIGLLCACGIVVALPLVEGAYTLLSTYTLPGGIQIHDLDLFLSRDSVVQIVCAGFAIFVVVSAASGLFVSAIVKRLTSVELAARSRSGRNPLPTTLMAAQLAVSVILLTGTILLVQAVQSVLRFNPSVQADKIVTVDVWPLSIRNDLAAADRLFDAMLLQLNNNPAVQGAARVTEEGGMGPMGKLEVDGVPKGFPTKVTFLAADDSYFSVMGLSATTGRALMSSDVEKSPLVAVVSDSLARLIQGSSSAVGHTITLPHRPGEPGKKATIVGVVPDVVVEVSVRQPLTMYFSIRQLNRVGGGTLVARARSDTRSCAAAIAAASRVNSSDTPPAPPRSLEEGLVEQLGPQRFASAVLGSLAFVAMTLTIVCVYVQTQLATTTRRQELAIRSAVGASRGRLLRLLLQRTARVLLVGIGFGSVSAWIVVPLIEKLLFANHSSPIWTVLFVDIVLACVATGVAVSPALRAVRMDVARVLRGAG